MPSYRRPALVAVALAIAALYLYKLDGVGVLSDDEPRYAAIGLAMAHTGDFVTPRLWGSPWFEKPPLLYWMTAAGATAGLTPELAARLPVVLLSLAFLGVSFFLLRAEFGDEPAAIAVALLATSAGWITFSELSLTDLPLSVFFSLAVFFSLPLLREQPETSAVRLRFVGIGVCIGLAALAKGLVPIALALPLFWFLRPFWRNWWLGIISCLVIAVPWYWAAYLRNGYPLIQELFIKHHFERLYSASLQHVQPWYYYGPVLLAGLFPWTPLLALLALQPVWDRRRRFLIVVFGFGIVMFSASLNKLSGYLLPLFPSLFVLLGSQFENKSIKALGRPWFVSCALLIACIPLIASALPRSLAIGRFSPAPLTGIFSLGLLFATVPILAAFLAPRSWAGVLLLLSFVAGGIYLKTITFPVLDQDVSARGMWSRIKGISDRICDGGTNRTWLFGLTFYRGARFPVCGNGSFDFRLHSPPGRPMPELEPIHP